VPDRAQTVIAVRRIITERWPQRFAAEQLDEDRGLGAGGLGLDSIEIAELVLACEDVGGPEASPELFDADPLTIGKVAEYFCSSPA
jgi:acyl carrier protein